MARETGPITFQEQIGEFLRNLGVKEQSNPFKGPPIRGFDPLPGPQLREEPQRPFKPEPLPRQPAPKPDGPVRERRFQVAQRSGQANDAIAPDVVIQGLVNRGLPLTAAQGLAGNIQQESGFRPGVKGDRGNAFGLFQFNGPRKDAFMAFAQSRNQRPEDPEAQLDFAIHELNTTERRARERLLAAPDARSAAIAASEAFFRPSDPRMENRVRAAERFSGGPASPQGRAAVADQGPLPEFQAPQEGPPLAGIVKAVAALYGVPLGELAGGAIGGGAGALAGQVAENAVGGQVGEAISAAAGIGDRLRQNVASAAGAQGSPIRDLIEQSATAPAPAPVTAPEQAPLPDRPTIAPTRRATQAPQSAPQAPQRPTPPAISGLAQAAADRFQETGQLRPARKRDFHSLFIELGRRSKARLGQ